MTHEVEGRIRVVVCVAQCTQGTIDTGLFGQAGHKVEEILWLRVVCLEPKSAADSDEKRQRGYQS